MEFSPRSVVETFARIPALQPLVFVAFRSPSAVDGAARTMLLDVLPTSFYMRHKKTCLVFPVISLILPFDTIIYSLK